ncbi:MAG: hypothetical protein QHJ73_06910, partial [Armatimonadota bacterium]|nr:hypothetical protein [Armatimonadota bacterium]
MTPLKKALLKHALGVMIVACGVVLLVWAAAPDPDVPVRLVFGVAALATLGVGGFLVMRGLRDAAVSVVYAVVAGDTRHPGLLGRLREEFYLALDYRTLP